MIFVKTRLEKSNIHGVGCFADEDIPKGTIIWAFTPGFDQEFSRQILEKLSTPARAQFLKYAYVSKKTGNYILCTDDTRFFNYSENNNVKNVPMEGFQEGVDIATKNIKKGEELLYDYLVFANFDVNRL